MIGVPPPPRKSLMRSVLNTITPFEDGTSFPVLVGAAVLLGLHASWIVLGLIFLLLPSSEGKIDHDLAEDAKRCHQRCVSSGLMFAEGTFRRDYVHDSRCVCMRPEDAGRIAGTE